MRIAYIVPQCTTTNSHGRYVLEMVNAFGPNHEVHVISGSFPPRRLPATTRQLPLPNAPTVARLAAWWAMAPLFVCRRGFDIIHTIGADAPVGTIITAPCCNRGIRLALDRAAEPNYSQPRSRWLTRSMAVITESADRYCVTRAAVRRVLAPSRQVATELESLYGVSPTKLALVPWGVDQTSFSPNACAERRDSARTAFGVADDELLLMTLGGAYWLKGLRTLLEALRGIEDSRVRLMLVGVRPNAELLAEEQRGLAGRIVFTGALTDVLQAYAAADAFVLPTLYDGFSLATLEALACGLPVVVSGHAGISDWLTAGRDALILEHPTDVEGLRLALSRVAADAGLRQQLSMNGCAVAQKYSWSEVATRVMAEYQAAA